MPILVAALTVTVLSFAALPNPALYRPVLALVIAASLTVIAMRQVSLAVLLTFGYVVLLALLRRILIPSAGWSAYDPLLLVAPAVSTFVLVRLLTSERRVSKDVLPRMVGLLLLLTLVQALNPMEGGVLAGISGLLFLAAPLIWFFIGREFKERSIVATLVSAVVISGCLIALYGLVQTLVGLPWWDAMWVQLGGYTSLRVAGVMRAFGTFTSSTEYATYLGVSIVIVVAMLLHRRWLALTALPILVWALALSSNRTVVVLALVATAVLTALRIPDGRMAAGALMSAAIMVVIAVRVAGPAIEASAQDANNTLIAHLVGGLVDPLNPDQSTLLLHVQRIGDGLSQVAHNPLGLGTAATNLAGEKFGAPTARTEIDITNAFVSLGIPGGVLFVAIVIAIFVRVIAVSRARANVITLAVVGALIVSLGQWLNGGQYAVAPLVWFLAGWASQQSPLHGESMA